MASFRIDLHNHCSCDPIDVLDYSARQLIDEAKKKGIDVLAITPHRDPFVDSDAQEYARSQNICLIAGVERFISGKEVVILNAPPGEFHRELTFEDLRKLRDRHGSSILTIAPHPFYPRKTCLGDMLDPWRDCIDAVEFAHLHGLGINPNRKAVEWAARNSKPVIANSDSHTLGMLGRNASTVEAQEATPEAIFDAIRAGHVKYQPKPLSLIECSAIGATLVWQNARRILRKPSPVKIKQPSTCKNREPNTSLHNL